MMRKLVSTILLLLASTGAYPLGLGDIELNSGLNQPFDARIELRSVTPSEMDSLAVRLADLEAFNRAGIELTMVLGSLSFEIVQNETGSDYIHITTREAVREPFLNFLLEASWASGRLFREYTVLLDPPLYDPNARQITSSAASNTATVAEPRSPAGSSTSASTAVPRSIPSYSGNNYGPTSANDTLWSISNQVRPDSGVTTQQMMLALLRSNPEAFIGGNINGLRQGTILRLPDRDDITTTSAVAALAEVRSQNSMWEQMRGSFAGSTSQRAVGSTTQPDASSGSATDAATDAELRLVSGGSAANGGQATASSSVANGADLAMANEQLEALASENENLRSRLEETENWITDLRRLIELKDDELASLQQQMAAGEVINTIDSGMEEPQSDEMADAEPAMAEPEEQTTSAEPEVVEQAPAPVVTTQPEVTASSGGLVDSILTFIFGNIILVGGAIAAVVIAIAGLTFIRKRKEAAVTEADAAVTEFPDFDAPADETDMVAGSDMDIADEADAAEIYPEQDLDVAIEAEKAEPEQDIAEAAPAESAAAEDEPEDDPLAEVNVFLAYEHFDQAEEFVRAAIAKDANNLGFHSKLLEVFYSSGDKARYEEEARLLHDLVNGEGPHWEMAMIMWQEISPNRALFAEPEDGEEDVDITESKGGGIVDLTADDDSSDDDSLDFDLGMGSTAEEDANEDNDVLDITSGSDDVLDLTADSSNGEDEDLLDVTAAVGLGSDDGDDDSILLDLDMGEDSDDDGGISLDLDAGDDSDDSDSGFSLDLDTDTDSGDDNLDISLDDSISLDMGEDADSDSGLSIDIDSDGSGDGEHEFSLEIDMDDDTDSPNLHEIDMDNTVEVPKDTNLGLDTEDDEDDDDDENHTVFVPRTSDSGEQSAEDEVATKLDLAKAYVELGDNDSAGAILDEIIAEGNDAQREQAEELKGQIS